MADGSVVFDTKIDESGLETGLSKLGGAVKTGLTAAVVGATAAIGALTKQSVEAYADYEQLVGGVETLFKSSADVVMGYAANAYKTAGLSANQYMETVTSFSASLLQSLGGDTKEAAEMADLAITDMADNANKMGTDMSLIQSAYQGFAKQNYTMLDNLKLGYGGTATEMARLINDSGVLGDKMIDLGDKQNIGAALAEVGYAKMIEAIHVVQTEMGITGTTAKEASETISGSIASAKSAWQNLVAGFANDEADLTELIGQFTEAAKTAFGNIVPALTTALAGIGDAVQQIAPIISDELPAMIEAVLPGLLSAGTSLIEGLLTGIVQALPVLASSAVQIIDSLSTTLLGLLPTLLDAGGQVILTLISGLSQTLPQLLEMIPEIIMQLLSSLQTQFPLICEAGIELLQNLASGFASNIPALLEQILPMILSLTETIRNNWTKVVDAGIDLIMKLVDGLIEGLPTLIEYVPTIITNMVGLINDNLPKIITAGVEIIAKLVVGLIKAIPTIVSNLPQIINAIVNVFTAFNWVNLGKSIITGLGNGLKSMVSFVKNIGSEIVNAVKSGLSNLPSAMVNIGKNIVQGLYNGVKSMISWFTGQIKSFFTGIISAAKNALGIRSPSKLFRDIIGKNIVRGLAGGITDNAQEAMAAAEDLASDLAGVSFTMQDPQMNVEPPKLDLDPDDYDYSGLLARVRGAVATETAAAGAAVSAGRAAELYRGSGQGSDTPGTENGSSRPKTVYAEVKLDGKTVARQLGPYMEKELEWRDK